MNVERRKNSQGSEILFLSSSSKESKYTAFTMEKGTHCLSIICENHIFQDSIGFL